MLLGSFAFAWMGELAHGLAPSCDWRVVALARSVSLVRTFYALSRLPTHVVLTLTNTFPLWVAVLSWPLLGERPPGSVWLAAGCGVLGVALIQKPLDAGRLAGDNVAALVAL